MTVVSHVTWTMYLVKAVDDLQQRIWLGYWLLDMSVKFGLQMSYINHAGRCCSCLCSADTIIVC